MKLARWSTLAGSLSLALLLSLPALGDTTTDRHTATPGTLNYVEGQATIGDQALNPKSVGSADVQNGQSLTTEKGKAEILLTPGVFLRLGDNSSGTMVSNSITDTHVALNQGEAMLEVDQIYPENNIVISQEGARTRILKTGLYAFDTATHTVRVFDGKADVYAEDHKITVKGGHELALNASAKLKAQDFNKKEVAANDDLYRWSSLRSEYLSQANVDTAQLYYANGWWSPGWGAGYWGPGWWGAGWYWNPWFAGFTFMPWNGYLYSPFGWGFYSPYWGYRAPFIAGGGFHHFDGSRPVAIGHGFHGNAVHAFNGGTGFGGVHGGNVGSFHGGSAGGFHGGGMGGFHGGGGFGGGMGGGHGR